MLELLEKSITTAATSKTGIQNQTSIASSRRWALRRRATVVLVDFPLPTEADDDTLPVLAPLPDAEPDAVAERSLLVIAGRRRAEGLRDGPAIGVLAPDEMSTTGVADDELASRSDRCEAAPWASAAATDS